MKRSILLSLALVVAVGAGVMGATGAFFSDSEVSRNNIFTAGAIDLGIDNTSYYNGVLNPGTSWSLDFDIDPVLGDNPETTQVVETDFVLEAGRLFFNFNDLKPGDYGEDTISLHVTDNESWLCADVTLTENDDVDCNEPETDAEGLTCQNNLPAANADGDLAQQINFIWWADDGDNVLEDDETALPAGPLGALGVGNTAHVALADADENIFGTPGQPILTDDPAEILYIGKAWCFGPIAAAPVNNTLGATSPAGNNDGNQIPGQPTDGGYTCSGASIGNEAQTDRVRLDVAFRAEQARHNAAFQCNPRIAPETATVTVDKVVTFTSDQIAGVDVTDFALTITGPGGATLVTDNVATPGLPIGVYSISKSILGFRLM
ncbi:MAG: TasA family protein [Minisyncoccia bacterium]